MSRSLGRRLARHPHIPRMVLRALFIWWKPARRGDGWASINGAWHALDRAFVTAESIHGVSQTRT
jgi:hypothetical protein